MGVRQASQLPVVPRTARTCAARGITEILAPAVLAAAMPLIVGATHHPLWVGLCWGAFAAVFGSAIPYAVIFHRVAMGDLTDRHMYERSQRAQPITLAVLSVVVSLTVALAGDAPRRMIAMIVVMLAVLAVTGVVNLVWKSSAHAAVAGGSATVLVLLFGAWAWLSIPAVVAVCWSRVALRDHTTAQTIVGVLLGVVISAAAWTLIT